MRPLLIVIFVCSLSVPARLYAETAADYLARGSASFSHGEFDKAIAAYSQALAAANPKDPNDKQTITGAYRLCAMALTTKHEDDKAIADYTKLLEIDPREAHYYFARAMLWSEKKEYGKAIADVTQAAAINPRNDFAYSFRGRQYLAKGEYDKALADFAKAAEIAPGSPWPYGDLANLYATCPDAKYRDGKKAVENAKKAAEYAGKGSGVFDANKLTSGGKDWYSLATLAAAYAESGDFAKASKFQGEAIEAAYPEDKKKMSSRLELYKQGKPYHAPPVKK